MNGEGLIFRTFDAPPEASAATVDAGLDRHNHSVAPLSDVMPLASFASDSMGQVVGGAIGRTWGKCCELLQLWVAPELRTAGVGSRLLLEFERHARGRGCSVYYLTTLSFQAPDFYTKHGYDVLARISGYPDGIIKYLMHKTIE